MKTLSKTALISAFSIIAAATHVQADQRSIALSANVPGTCSIGTVTGGTNFTSSTTAFEATISNAKAISKIGQLTINYVCTSQTVALTLASANDGITGPIAGNGSTTTNKINYTAKLLNSGGVLLATLDTTPTGNTAATNAAKVNDTPVSGALTFELAIIPTGSPSLVASSAYADTLTITIDPGA